MNEQLATVTQQETLSLVPADPSFGALEAAIGMGDFSRLTSADRMKYLAAVCQSVGLNPLTKPIDIISIGGKVVMYANKGCAEQLRKIHGVAIEVVERRIEHGCYVVIVRARDKSQRTDESIGAVPIPDNARGEILANAMMKAETKAKRRVSLSICGLGMIDESELDTVSSSPPPAPMIGVSAQDKADTLNAEIVALSAPRTVTMAPIVAMPSAQAETIVPAAPAPTALTANSVQSAATGPILDPEILAQVEDVIGLHGLAALEWLRSENNGKAAWLLPHETLEHLTPEEAKRIVRKKAEFIAAITGEGGAK